MPTLITLTEAATFLALVRPMPEIGIMILVNL